MVTHDPRYEEFADRTIHLFDGRIVEESAEAAREKLEGCITASPILRDRR